MRKRMEANDLLISPVVMLGLQCRFEVRKLKDGPERIMDAVARAPGIRYCSHPFEEGVREAGRQTWTRHPFDRPIAAHALLLQAPLLTQDRTIRDHVGVAVWR